MIRLARFAFRLAACATLALILVAVAGATAGHVLAP